MITTPGVTPYAGVAQPRRLGLPVAECATRAGRFGFFSHQLMRVQAAKMSSVENWELKAMLGRQLWECALHWGWWRERVRELRGHEHLIAGHADDKLGDFFNEILWSQGDAEFATALYVVALPAYQAALRRYSDETNPLVDYPTVRLIRHMSLDLEDHAAFGHGVLTTLVDEARVKAWRDHLQAYLDAAGNVDGVAPTTASYALPATRAEGEWRVPQDFARDRRFTTTIPKTNPYQETDVVGALLSKMWVRSQEMTAAELCATVLYEWDDLPYEGCVDLARHCWDEVRHSLFGQAALEGEGVALTALPNWVGYAGHTMPCSPQKRYSHLAIATEANAMGYPGGKRGEWEWCRDEAQHLLMTTYQDFDWADEVNHVGFGRRWLIQHYLNGDRGKAQALADETVQDRLSYYAEHERSHRGAGAARPAAHEPGKDGY